MPVDVSWIIPAVRLPPNSTQTAYQLELWNSSHLVWQSDIATGSETSATLPAANASMCSFRWRVRAATQQQQLGGWSAFAPFDTAPTAADWASSEWIGRHDQLRAELPWPFAPGADAQNITRARAHAIGLGAFYLHLNGVRVSDHYMDPPQSAYPSRTAFSAFDVGALMRPGQSNVLGLELGNYKFG